MPPVAFLPVLLTTASVVVVFFAERRRHYSGVLVSLALAIAAITYLIHETRPGRTVGLDLPEYTALAIIVAATGTPGVALAMFAARRQGTARGALLVAALFAAVILGLASVVTALAVWCACTGDCL